MQRKSKGSNTFYWAVAVGFAAVIIIAALYFPKSESPAPDTSPSAAPVESVPPSSDTAPSESPEPTTEAAPTNAPKIKLPSADPTRPSGVPGPGDIHIGIGGADKPKGKGEPEKITLNKTELTLTKGNSYTFQVDYEPEAALRELTWSSSDEGVVAISEKRKITGIAEGTATVTARTPNGKTGTCTVTVREPAGAPAG